MDFDETMVEQDDQVTEDDAQFEGLTEETDDSEQELDEVLEDDEGTEDSKPAEQSKETQPQGTSEPGWIKKRIDKALTKQRAELEAAYDAKLEAALAPFREQQIESQARELVRTGAVKDLETAKELVRYRQNQPQPQAQPTPSVQPRNDKGQFTPRRDPETQARVDLLAHQADRIKERQGIDVTKAFMENEDIKEKVVSGEWDFYDVADHLRRQPKRKTSAPMRSPNGADGANVSTIATMSDEQFRRLDKSLDEGKRYRVK